MSEAEVGTVGDVLDVENTALLIHGLTASPDVPITVAVLSERIAAVRATGRKMLLAG